MSTPQENQWKRRGIKGASIPLYLNLLEKQKGVCAICGAPPKTRKLALDHDHRTGTIRGLLCYHCNYGLRWFEWFNKSPERLSKALGYLSDSKGDTPNLDSQPTPTRPSVAARRIEALSAIQKAIESMPDMPVKSIIDQVAVEMGLSARTLYRYMKVHAPRRSKTE